MYPFKCPKPWAPLAHSLWISCQAFITTPCMMVLTSPFFDHRQTSKQMLLAEGREACKPRWLWARRLKAAMYAPSSENMRRGRNSQLHREKSGPTAIEIFRQFLSFCAKIAWLLKKKEKYRCFNGLNFHAKENPYQVLHTCKPATVWGPQAYQVFEAIMLSWRIWEMIF